LAAWAAVIARNPCGINITSLLMHAFRKHQKLPATPPILCSFRPAKPPTLLAMRVALVAVFTLGATAAHAETFKPSVIWDSHVNVFAPQPVGPIELTNVSHTLYLNDCMPNGCSVSPGADDSILNKSSIANTTVVLGAYPNGTNHWNALVQCVKDTFAPFDINIVTTDPGSTPHFEVMIGGRDTDLNPQLNAGGVAPYLSCNAKRSNGLSFVFPIGSTTNLNYLCGAVVQEATHVWGLDHELNAKDPMTYLDLGSSKRFQNDDANCGESTPRACRSTAIGGCGGNTQNSYRYMINTFGLKAGLAEPTVAITAPKEGEWVKAGFAMVATMGGPLDPLKVDFTIDGMPAGTTKMMPYAVNSPMNVTGGPHAVTVTGSDMGDRTAMATVNVNVMSSCAAGESCVDNTHCLGGFCQPGDNVAGGLGATCAGNGDCITGLCGTVDSDSKCTAACDANKSCPSGYDCIDDGGAGVCWPGSGGGCSVGGNPTFLLGGLALMLLGRRRRR
jgi:MYXO-CTERM domain-containing protein